MITRAFAHYLDGLGLLTYGRAGTDAFLEDLPDKPVASVGIYSRPGGAGTDGGHGYDEPGVQFVVRGDPNDPDTPGRAASGYARAESIRKALHGLASVTLGEGTADAVWLVQCLATQSAPVNISDDADNRPKWSVEVRCEVYDPTALRP